MAGITGRHEALAGEAAAAAAAIGRSECRMGKVSCFLCFPSPFVFGPFGQLVVGPGRATAGTIYVKMVTLFCFLYYFVDPPNSMY